MDTRSKIYVAGHSGLVGSALVRLLLARGYSNLALQTRSEMDLTHADEVDRFFANEGPEYVILLAARVGGILANQRYPVHFLRDNLQIQDHVISASYRCGVKRLLFFGSSCIYPRMATQPIREEDLLTGPLEPTNRAYALAKIAGIELCRSYNQQYGTRFLCCMPANIYGPHNHFDPESSHVVPALLRKMLAAKMNGRDVVVWGTGTPRRELIYSVDVAEACLFLLNLPDAPFHALTSSSQLPTINIGTGQDMSIRELAAMIADIVGFAGRITFDPSMPDGTPRKLLDTSRMNSLGWHAVTRPQDGIRLTYEFVRSRLEMTILTSQAEIQLQGA